MRITPAQCEHFAVPFNATTVLLDHLQVLHFQFRKACSIGPPLSCRNRRRALDELKGGSPSEEIGRITLPRMEAACRPMRASLGEMLHAFVFARLPARLRP